MEEKSLSAPVRVGGMAGLVREGLDKEDLFSGLSKSYCVGLVDIVNSTSKIAQVPSKKIWEYYGTFLNAMSTIVNEFGAKVIKNIGDSLLYYFPRTDYESGREPFFEVLDCSYAIIDSHDLVNKILAEKSLPQTDFRVSADYGVVTKSMTPAGEDLFGSTVNLCSKINTAASPNGVVIGGDLYQIVRSSSDYCFDSRGAYGLGLKFSYPVYSVTRRRGSKNVFS